MHHKTRLQCRHVHSEVSAMPRLDATVYDLREMGAVVGIAGRLDIQVG